MRMVTWVNSCWLWDRINKGRSMYWPHRTSAPVDIRVMSIRSMPR